MNIKGPTGFKKEWFGKNVIEALDKVQDLCQEISATLRKVIAEAEINEIQYFDNNFQPTRRDTRKDRLYSPDEWILRNFDYYFKDADWKEVKDGEEDPSLYITFWLGSHATGAEVGLWWRSPDKYDKQEVIKEIREKAEKDGLIIDEDFLADEGGLSIYHWISPETLENEGQTIADTLINELVEMRNFAESIESLRRYLGYRNKSRTRRNK